LESTSPAQDFLEEHTTSPHGVPEAICQTNVISGDFLSAPDIKNSDFLTNKTKNN
jgi:hypothetical protein